MPMAALFKELRPLLVMILLGGGGGEALNKVLYGEAPPRGPNPYPFI